MKQILWISMCLPIDNAFHAGGKTFNYYINKFCNDGEYEISLIAKVLPEEKRFIETIDKKIDLHLVATPQSGLKRFFAYAKSINSKINPCYKYGNTLTKEIYNQIEKKLRCMREDGYSPDIVILEWTSILLFIDCVKKYFPDAKYIASEHDVTFLGKKRAKESEHNYLKRLFRELTYQYVKRYELQAIQKCDLVMTHNFKDKKLLLDNGVPDNKIDIIVPYYDNYSFVKRNSSKKDIMFYGAMNRVENYNCAIWFIDNVLPHICDLNIRFVVVGNKPPKILLERKCDIVEITGFVEDVTPFFETSMCFVAPLTLGAGIKVKIVESLSAGIPILTNEVGIEGIEAVNNVHYIHCESADDYIEAIREIYNDNIDANSLSINAQNLISSNYNLEESYLNYKGRVELLFTK